MKLCKLLTSAFFMVATSSTIASVPSDLLQSGYKIYSSDQNGDGCRDYLLRVPDRILMIDLDDLIIPIPIKSPNVPIVLMSSPSCLYGVDDNSSSLAGAAGWMPENDYQLLMGDVRGDGGGSILMVPSGSSGKPMFNLVRTLATKSYSLLQTLRASEFQVSDAGDVVSLEYVDADQRSDILVRRNGKIVATYSAAADGSFNSSADDNAIALSYAVWKTFLDSISVGKINESLDSVSLVTREVFRAALEAPGADFELFVKSISKFEVVDLEKDYVKAAIVVSVNGQDQMYFVSFGRDSDGVWRIYSM